jgi:hypothetical protein
MVNGIVVSVGCSRVCEPLFSMPNSPFPLYPARLVGDGSTSASLGGGSFLVSEFQIPAPQGKDADPVGPRPIPEVDVVDMCGPQAPDSAEGVVGWEVVGDMELLAKEFFRGWVSGWVVSLSQEARRTGF